MQMYQYENETTTQWKNNNNNNEKVLAPFNVCAYMCHVIAFIIYSSCLVEKTVYNVSLSGTKNEKTSTDSHK